MDDTIFFDVRLIGQAIACLRGNRPQSHVARAAGIPPATWCQWEKGTRMPRAQQQVRILKGLGCSREAFERALFDILRQRVEPEGSSPRAALTVALYAPIPPTNTPEELRLVLLRFHRHLHACAREYRMLLENLQLLELEPPEREELENGASEVNDLP